MSNSTADMTTKANQARDAAAEEYVSGGYGCDGDTFKDSFLKGVQWAITHDPTVKGLRDALAINAEFLEMVYTGKIYYDDLLMGKIKNAGMNAREALEAYEKAVTNNG